MSPSSTVSELLFTFHLLHNFLRSLIVAKGLVCDGFAFSFISVYKYYLGENALH